jgi:hypothetical protein
MPSRPTQDQPDAMPTRKMLVGAVASLLTALVIGLAHRLGGWDPTPDTAAAVGTVAYFVAGYIVPEWRTRGHGSSG